ncbi:hypothetical protein [Trichocoleus sp. FACHB-262]|uniref:hypothetical protein n=1 Tax=Trichocoleus sp. FACHB-262 TaxID=2692869 RepID=UPI00168271BC|nr:hypothetical protein [Trichocoleus sp. FACHB-262]MBD2120441.1 hypothetical protein [Trichocoleus sp. FACHB-262]
MTHPRIPMTEMLIGSIAIALAFTAILCGIVYAIVSELGGLKPAQRRVARRRMVKHGTLAFGIVLMFHSHSFFLATVIAGGSGLLIFIFMTVPLEPSTDSLSTSSTSTSYRPPN